MRVWGNRHRRLLDLLVRTLPGAVDGVADVSAGAALGAMVVGPRVGLSGGRATLHASPAVKVQSALVHRLMLTGHGGGDMSGKSELQPPYLARQMSDSLGSDRPKFVHGVVS